MPKLSLIVATISRVTELERLLDSLAAQTCGDFEVIIADQNVDDRLKPLIERAAAGGLSVSHLRMDQPSLVLARNAGLKMAKGQYLAFPDDDCWYDNDTVERVLERFENDDCPSIVVANWLEMIGPVQQERRLDVVRFSRFREIMPSSIMLFLARRIFERIGEFDPRFGLGGKFGAGEEVDLVLRALRAGVSVVFFPQAVVHHEFRRRPAADLNSVFRVTRSRARGAGALYAKHDLEKWIILRGFVTPLARAAMHCFDRAAFWSELGNFVGRAEGYLEYRRDHG